MDVASLLTDEELDAILLAEVKERRQKVVMVIGMAMSGYEIWDEERVGQRIIVLVEAGKVEAFGDARKWRFSEIRLPTSEREQA